MSFNGSRLKVLLLLERCLFCFNVFSHMSTLLFCNLRYVMNETISLNCVLPIHECRCQRKASVRGGHHADRRQMEPGGHRLHQQFGRSQSSGRSAVLGSMVRGNGGPGCWQFPAGIILWYHLVPSALTVDGFRPSWPSGFRQVEALLQV